MSVRAGQDASTVMALVAERWAGLDRLLPVPPGLAGGELLAVPGAVGRCEHWAGQPGSLDLTWGAARRFRGGWGPVRRAWPPGRCRSPG